MCHSWTRTEYSTDPYGGRAGRRGGLTRQIVIVIVLGLHPIGIFTWNRIHYADTALPSCCASHVFRNRGGERQRGRGLFLRVLHVALAQETGARMTSGQTKVVRAVETSGGPSRGFCCKIFGDGNDKYAGY